MGKLDDVLDEVFGKKKPKIVENSIKRIKVVDPGQLNPPPAIQYEEVKNADIRDMPYTKALEKRGIDFSYLANNSSFQRAIMEFIKKFVPGMEAIKPRASKEVMNQSFNQNASNYREVMKELKEKLAERRKKVDGS